MIKTKYYRHRKGKLVAIPGRVAFKNQVDVTNTHMGLLEEIQRRTNVGHIYPMIVVKKHKWANRRPVFVWRIRSEATAAILPHVIPWLIIKRKQAELLLESCYLASQNSGQTNRTDSEGTKERVKRRFEIHAEMATLNRKGGKRHDKPPK